MLWSPFAELPKWKKTDVDNNKKEKEEKNDIVIKDEKLTEKKDETDKE